ncbi:S8 family peptidase [Anaerosporobacter sp.]|uniref:S8 family peptidase n=1 Tax=Anaerosporobacter sp. TaxID=1872529 RepID=UPI00286EBAB1|nr:S8 family peptidase [Anaerosporobacter sp.]
MQEILSENYYDQIIDNGIVPFYDVGTNITFLNERHSLLNIPVIQPDLCDVGINPYHRFPSIYTTQSTTSLEKSNISEVQRNPYLALYGQGILVGVIDTGVDYLHPTFCYADNSSKIMSIWDQSIQGESIPEGFTFGTEFTREEINVALQSPNPLEIVPSIDEDGHGTAMASIIVGNQDLGNSFSGVVPEAELVVVKLKQAKQNLRKLFCIPEEAMAFEESDIMLGVRYVLSVAQRCGKPVAICMGLGSSQGGHDGRGALSSYLNYIAQLSRAGVAVSAGNEGNRRRHYYGSVTEAIQYKDFELLIDSRDSEFALEIWADTPSRLAIVITAPTGETTQLIYPKIGICNRYDFVFNQTRVWVNNIIFEEETGDPLILVRFQNPMQGIWRFRVQSIERESASFHAWLPSEYLISRGTYFLESDPNTTITSPGNGIHSLTVTAYNQETDSILIGSSRGYSRIGGIKPDIAAPGYQLTCALPNGKYGSLTGTGAAAAHTAGVIAIILEWAVPRENYPSITGNNINHLIIRGAQRDKDYVYPNNIWGYGKINVSGVFERLS